MSKLSTKWGYVVVVLLLNLPSSFNAIAHLMVAQHGSLNVVDEAIFMVLSLPVSGFKGFDDDGDGLLSIEELNVHREAITNEVHSQIILEDDTKTILLEGIMLSPVVSHEKPKEPVSHLVVMGRFTVSQNLASTNFKMGIFGNEAKEKVMKMRLKRKSDNYQRNFDLTPENIMSRLID